MIRFIRLGAAAGIDATTRGTVYFDAFESRLQTYIGPDPAALPPVPFPEKPDALFADGFEAGNLSAWSTTTTGGGDLSVTAAAALSGGQGLQALINDNTSLYLTDWKPFDETHYRARFHFDPNSIAMANGDTISLWQAFGRDMGNPSANVRLRYSVGEYQIQGGILNDANGLVFTPWVTISDGPHAVEIEWTAATTGANNGLINLWLDGSQAATLANVDNDTRRVDYATLGPVNIPGGTRGTLYFDAFESRRESLIGPDASALPPVVLEKPDALFADGFENGNVSNWTQSVIDGGDLSVSTGAALQGTKGLQAVIDDNVSIYLTDWKPFDETHYRARFLFDPNSLSMANNDAHFLFFAYDRNNGVVARTELRSYNGAYQVRVDAANDGGSFTNNAWTTISDVPHTLELEWKAATGSGNNDGVLNFWVDEVQAISLANLDNETRRVDYVQLGAVNGVDNGTRGTEYFDAFESRRESYIGPQAALQGGARKALAALAPVDRTSGGEAQSEPDEKKGPNPEPLMFHLPGQPGLADLPALPLRVQGLPTTQTITYTYDPLYRLKTAVYSDGTSFAYTYDAVGNRLTQTRTGGLAETYTYDNANRLATVNGQPYTWDANGNLLSDGVNSYTYDDANRLVGVSRTGLSASYGYRCNGLSIGNGCESDRVSQTVNGVTTNYVLDQAAGLTQVLSDGTNTYLYGKERTAQYHNDDPAYFLTDALGSVRQLVDGNGTIILAQDYAPYGEELSSVGSGSSSYGFTGEADDPTGLLYLRARYMHLDTGRFLTKDPWRGSAMVPMSYNAWLYTNANPIIYTDRTGLCIDQEGSPRRCIVYPGDTLSAIAKNRQLSLNEVIAWNQVSHGGDWDPNWIYPNEIIYLEDPSSYLAQQQKGPFRGDVVNGYIEGTGTTIKAGFTTLQATGKEVVYDFQTLQRADFTYTGKPVILNLFCGLATDLFGLGTSWYAGFFHFPPNDTHSADLIYGGTSMSLSVGKGTGKNPLQGISKNPIVQIMGGFDIGSEVTAFISNAGEPIAGIPTVENIFDPNYGATISLSEGVSVSRLPVGVQLMFLDYHLVTLRPYKSADEMARDILSGEPSSSLNIPAATALFSAARRNFATHLIWMYVPTP